MPGAAAGPSPGASHAAALRRPPRALVFDLDGTLVDSRRDIAEACNHALAALGRPPLDEATIASYVGDGARMLLARALQAAPDGDVVGAALVPFHAFYAKNAAAHTTWMPGALDTLRALAPLPLALATNKPRTATMALLSALGAAGLFVAVVTGDDGPLKPRPDPILKALGPTGVAAEEAWVVGDGVQDVAAAKAAGATSIAVLGGFASEDRLRAAHPDVVIARIGELVGLVTPGHFVT